MTSHNVFMGVYASGQGVNASHYTREELTETRRYHELEHSGYTVLCLDMGQTGIGSESCGWPLAEQYRLSRELSLKLKLNFEVE